LSLRFSAFRSVARIPLRSLKIILDHSKARFTANLKLTLWAQTLDLRPFRFTKNGLPKFFNVRSREPGQQPVPKWLSRRVPHSSCRFRSGTTVFLQKAIKLKNEKIFHSRSELVFPIFHGSRDNFCSVKFLDNRIIFSYLKRFFPMYCSTSCIQFRGTQNIDG
jgi:hypothetical protein